MTESVNKSRARQSLEARLDELVEEISAELQSGKIVELERYADEYPDLADSLRSLYPTLEAMAMLGFADSDEALPPPADAANQKRTLGDYRIIKEIGRGGMGVVYEAEQLSLGRRVALKILPFAAVLDPRQLDRFKNEAFAAAQLHHANIVPVYGIGCERGVYFYAMQLIEGQTLADMIRQLRQLDPAIQQEPQQPREVCTDLTKSLLDKFGPQLTNADEDGAACDRIPDEQSTGSDKLARDTRPFFQAAISTERSTNSTGYVRTIVEFGIQIAEALEHAHDLGVVHRDIKPSNLILDQRHNVWITDFGLARIESNPGLTISGDLLGTLRYMSPEQSLGKQYALDHRTDIYSLGVTLYELLTLHPAVDGKDREHILHQIASRDPKSPRHWNPAVPIELETIVQKAISKNPGDRYDSAQSLGEDLQRYLDHKPIIARRPTTVHRIAKWTQRNPAIMWATMAVLCITVIALFVSNKVISGERERATKAEQATKTYAMEVERQSAVSKGVQDFLVYELLGQLGVNTPDFDPAITLRDAIKRATNKIGTRFSKQPLVEAAALLAATSAFVDDSSTEDYEFALNLAQRARDLRLNHLGPHHPDTLSAQVSEAQFLMTSGKPDAGFELLESTYRQCTRFLQPEDSATLEVLEAMGLYHYYRADFVKSKEFYEQVKNLGTARFGDEHPRVIETTVHLAELNYHLGNPKLASKQFEEVCVLADRVLGENSKLSISARSHLTKIASESGDIDRALHLSEELNELLTVRWAADSRLAHEMSLNTALILIAGGRLDEAERLLLNVKACTEVRRSDASDVHLRCVELLARVYRNKGDEEKWEQYHLQTFQLQRKLIGLEHPDTHNTLTNVGQSMAFQGKYSETIEFFESLIPEMESALQTYKAASPHPPTPNATCADAHCYLGIALGFEEDYEKSLSHLNCSIELWKSLPTSQSKQTTLNSVLSAKAATLAYLGDAGEAETAWIAYKKCRQSNPDETDTGSFFLAAKLYALRSLALSGRANETELSDSLLAKTYASRSIEMLHQFFHEIKLTNPEVAFIGMNALDRAKFEQLKNSDDFLSIRDRTDVQQLLSRIEAALTRKTNQPVRYFINSPQFRATLEQGEEGRAGEPQAIAR